ncbi:unnamed protein product [Schistosoma curassoni]|uniref:Uncharacterized protein n=1 Tax=Schistosoma curassoni TaxID=6186 RepID=A0A183KSB5_9TREM|nr:unnamed protein product [Schistosoma curassoni]
MLNPFLFRINQVYKTISVYFRASCKKHNFEMFRYIGKKFV